MASDPKTGRFVPKHAPIQIGEAFGLWTVLSKGSLKYNQQRWVVRCKCGFESEVAQQHLRGGQSTCCIKCSGKRTTQKSIEKNFGKFSSNRRLPVTKLAVDMLYESQAETCPICTKKFRSLSEAAWDHDHSTGYGRDLMHRGCNVVLGFIERDPEILLRLYKYCVRYGIECQKPQ